MNGRYPVRYAIDPPLQYNRWTVAFRLIIAIPQLILVGSGGYYFFGVNSFTPRGGSANSTAFFFNTGVLTLAMRELVCLAWWAILVRGHFPLAFRGFCLLIFRWSENVHAYIALQAAPYPPFSLDAVPNTGSLPPQPI